MKHPSPKQLAAYYRTLADKLDTNGGRALEMAEVLASRGYPASTGGNGARSSDPTTTTERAALQGAPEKPAEGEQWQPGEWEDAPGRMADRFRVGWKTALALETELDHVLSHASTADQLPPGTGECCCGDNCARDGKTPTFCAPRRNGPSDRLRSGLAPNCYRRYARWKEAHPDGSVADWKHAIRRAREIAAEKAQQLAADIATLRS